MRHVVFEGWSEAAKMIVASEHWLWAFLAGDELLQYHVNGAAQRRSGPA